MGLVEKRSTIALPFVYAFITSKETEDYKEVLQSVKDAMDKHRLNFSPTKIMTDFELAIINASISTFPSASVSCCFFHLCQSLYKKVQSLGLQAEYNDPKDDTLNVYVRMLMAIAFVPTAEVVRVFNLFESNCIVEELEPMIQYFGETYVVGRIGARGRGNRTIPPRYPPQWWNHYDSTMNNEHRTNNLSEGWHNRFRLVVAKHHPDLYNAITEIQKEQADTESQYADFSIHKPVKALPKKNGQNFKSAFKI